MQVSPTHKTDPHRARARLALAAALGLLLSACAVPPERQPRDAEPPVSPPEAWVSETATSGQPTAWLADFEAPALEALVVEALRANPDLAATAARLRAAEARARITGAERLPQAQLDLDASRNRSVLEGPADSTTAVTRNRYGLEGSVAWEVDLWGRIGDEARAAVLDAQAAEADLQAARLALAARTARAWFAAVEARQQLELARTVVGFFAQSRDVIAERYRLGISNALDLRLARENVASAEGTRALRAREYDLALRELELVLGRYPARALQVPETLPELARAVPVGLPAELLERRPDLRAARERLAASGARLDAANKNTLPTIRLTGAAGTSSDELEDLLDYDALVWRLVAGVTQPIFQGGRLEAQRALAAADNAESWARYAQSVLTAFREVEAALAAEGLLETEARAQATAAEESREAALLALQRYRQGLTDIVTLLESQRRAVNAESTRLRVERQRLQNRVDLYLALGGPFAPAPELALGAAP
jgi:NodT family efflux transporter outer membrane factor (OMF) lipoprotein